MEKRGNFLGKRIKIIGIILVVVLAIALFLTLYKPGCKDLACFNDKLEKCQRTSFLKDTETAAIFYQIKGKSRGNCIVTVEIKAIKEGKTELLSLEGKEMTCKMPIGLTSSPEQNIDKCSGSLKEEMQNIIIQRMHSYVIENLGQISGEIGRVF